MPGFLVQVGASILCAHGGTATPVPTNTRVLAGGAPVLLQTDVVTVAGCALPPPPAANGPCVTANWITAATRVKVNGIPVVLADSQAICTPTGTPLTIVSTQTQVQGI
jgi:hypothetical protein